MFSLSPFPLAREPTVTAWRGTTLGRDITNAISLIMPLRFVRRLRNNMAQSLVLFVKSDARYGRRLAAPTGKTGGTRIEKYRHSYYATRSQVQRTTRTCSLVQPSCSVLICSPPLRLVFRLRSHTYHLYVRSKQAVRYGRIKYQFFLVILSEVEGSSVAKNQTIAPDKFFISLRIYKIFMD